MVQLSWQGASRKHSLTLSLTPKPASSESPASPSLSYHTAHQLGIRQCSKRPGPCGVGTQRRSCPGQRRERGELHDWGGGSGGAEPLGSMFLHTVTLPTLSSSTSGPHMLPSIPGEPFQLPLPAASCLSPAGMREGTSQCH